MTASQNIPARNTLHPNPHRSRIMSIQMNKSSRSTGIRFAWLLLLLLPILTLTIRAQSPEELDARLREVLRQAMQQHTNINQPLKPLAESTGEATATETEAAEEKATSGVVVPSASPKPLTRLPSLTGSANASADNAAGTTRRPPSTIPSLGNTTNTNKTTTPRPTPGSNLPLRQGVPSLGSSGTIPAPGGATGNNDNTTVTENGGAQNGIPDIAGLLAAAGGNAAGGDVEIQLIKDGDHRLSRTEDLRRLLTVVGRLLEDIAA